MVTGRSSSALWRHLRASGARAVAVMGMAKNTGKTVALNHLLAAAAADGVAVGLSSIGRDGEARDAVFDIPKPPVQVWPGTVVATARATLQRSAVRHRHLAGTGIDSPMGEIVLVQAVEAGAMEVAGASRSQDQRRVIEQLRRCGVQLSLLDGALGRSQHASPAVADAVVLATGAALGGSIADVLRKTGDRLALLGLPHADAETRARCRALFDGAGVALWGRQGEPLFSAPIASLNAGAALLQAAEAQGRAGIGTVACTGAVGQSLWQALRTLAERHPGLCVVVADGTRLFVERADLAALAQRGARVVAWQPIRIAGITLNPSAPQAPSFDAAEFRHAARAAWPQHVVTDVLLDSPTPSPEVSIDGPSAA